MPEHWSPFHRLTRRIIVNCQQNEFNFISSDFHYFHYSLSQLVDNEYAELWIFNKFTLPRTTAFEFDAILNNKIHLIRIFPEFVRDYDANFDRSCRNNTQFRVTMQFWHYNSYIFDPYKRRRTKFWQVFTPVCIIMSSTSRQQTCSHCWLTAGCCIIIKRCPPQPACAVSGVFLPRDAVL